MAIHKKCSPDAFASSIYNIDFETLKKQGIKALIFDLDNTLIPYSQIELEEKEISLLNNLEKDFKLLILSNSPYKRVKLALRNINIPFVHKAMKPLKGGFKKALKILNVKKSEVMVIGDQLMTDVFGSKRLDLNVTLVLPIYPKTEKWTTKFNRRIEKRVLKKIKKENESLYERLLKEYANR